MTFNSLDDFSPIFIVGNSRSGTTLFSRILGNSASVFAFDELHFFEQLWSPDSSSENSSREQSLKLAARLLNIQRNSYFTQKDYSEYIQEAQRVIEDLPEQSPSYLVFAAFLQYESRRNGKQRPCEQTPRNVLYIREILDLFPEARIINIVRDPRDILLSQKRKWRRASQADNIPKSEAFRSWVNYHPFTISKLWDTNIRAAERFRGDSRVYFMKFEDLLSQPEMTVRDICEFVNIPFESELLDVPQIGSSSEIDQPDSKGLNINRLEGWRKGDLSSTELFICQTSNKESMKRYSYETEGVGINVITLTLSFLFFPIKLALALLLNLNRMKNIRESIRRRLA